MAIANTDRDDYAISRLKAVDTLTDDLVALGVTSTKDAAKAHAAAHRAHHAQNLSAQYEQHIEAVATKSGDLFADTENLTLDAVLKAINLPTDSLADALLARVWNQNVLTAQRHAFGNINTAPAKLTERFDQIGAEVLAIAAELGDIVTPQQAIEADKVAEWQRLMVLKAEFNALTHLRSELRSFGLIPAPAGFEEGWHWQFRVEAPVGDFKRALDRKDAGDEGRALLIYMVKLRPYCPASSAEAKATLEAAQAARESVA